MQPRKRRLDRRKLLDTLAATKAANEQARAVSLVDALVRENKIAVGRSRVCEVNGESGLQGMVRSRSKLQEEARGRKIAEGGDKIYGSDSGG